MFWRLIALIRKKLSGCFQQKTAGQKSTFSRATRLNGFYNYIDFSIFVQKIDCESGSTYIPHILWEFVF